MGWKKQTFYVTYKILNGDAEEYYYEEPIDAMDIEDVADTLRSKMMKLGTHPDDVELIDVLTKEEMEEIDDLLDLDFED